MQPFMIQNTSMYLGTAMMPYWLTIRNDESDEWSGLDLVTWMVQ